jgi:hypothetical protein
MHFVGLQAEVCVCMGAALSEMLHAILEFSPSTLDVRDNGNAARCSSRVVRR